MDGEGEKPSGRLSISSLSDGMGMKSSRRKAALGTPEIQLEKVGEGFPSPGPGSYRGIKMEEGTLGIWRPTGQKEREVRSGVQGLASSGGELAYSPASHPRPVRSSTAQVNHKPGVTL